MNDIKLRLAKTDDAPEILKMYAYYINNTAVTFDYAPPSLEEFEARMNKVMNRYPFIIAEENGRIVGYSYAYAFKERAAYDWSVETSIYVDKDSRRKGIGKTLYEALEKCLKAQNVINLFACVAATPRENDEHLTQASLRFHEKNGYERVAYLSSCGYKFDSWYDMVWMKKALSDYPDKPKALIPFNEKML